MNEADLNTSEIESFFNFGKPAQEKPAPAPVIEEKTKNIPNFTAPPASVQEVERSGMTYIGEIPHHPTRKAYPERTFDKYVKKDARLEESDLEMLKAWANKISHVKRKLGHNSGSANRITDNTILRLLLSEFCDKLVMTFKDPSYKEVLTEEELRLIILKTMEKKS